MIAEWFYPKELKDVIADLRAKDDLNEVALRRLNYIVYYFVVPGFLLSLWGLVSEINAPNTGIELPLFCLLSLLILPFYCMKGQWRRWHASYFYGEKRFGVVRSVDWSGAWTICFGVQDENTGVLYQVNGMEPRTIFFGAPLFRPKVGDRISYYFVDRHKYCPNPAIYQYMKQQCLSKSLIERDRYAGTSHLPGRAEGI